MTGSCTRWKLIDQGKDSMTDTLPTSARIVQMFSALLAPLIAALVLLVSPYRRYRFAVMPVDEIGPLARNPHHYLWRKSHETTRDATRDIWVYKPYSFVCNELVLQKWRRQLPIKGSWLAWYVYRLVTTLSAERHSFAFERRWSELPSRNYQFKLSLASDEQLQFHREKAAMGLGDDIPHVVFCVRDAAYKTTERREPLARNVRESYRNHDIGDFREAALAVVEEGAAVVRIGVKVEKAFMLGTPGVIDFATSGLRTELSNLGLLSTANLCVSTSLGIDQLAAMSGVPRCVVNFFPTQNVVSFYPWDTLIFQRIRLRMSGRELSLRDSLDFLINYPFTQTADLDRCGLELVPNSPREIREVVLEALHRERKSSEISSDDRKLQSRFWELVRLARGDNTFTADKQPRIGVGFLRRHASILD